MNASVDPAMPKSFRFMDYDVSCIWLNSDIYLRGIDVCNILKLEDVNSSLESHVKNKFKTTSADGTVFINECGIHRLVKYSNAPISGKFQEWFCMKIRSFNSWMHKTMLINNNKELEQKLIKAKQFNIFINNVNVREAKLEWIYIATTEAYSKKRIFKIGSTERLASRIGPYNVGRIAEDEMYYAWVKPCYYSKDLDHHIQKMLSDFKYKNNRELYWGINFNDLVIIVEFLVNQYDKSIERVRDFIKQGFEQSMDKKDDAPPPLDLRRNYSSATDVPEVVNMKVKQENILEEELRKALTSLIIQHGGNRECCVIITRREHHALMSTAVGKLNKHEHWRMFKKITDWKSGVEMTHEGLKYKMKY